MTRGDERMDRRHFLRRSGWGLTLAAASMGGCAAPGEMGEGAGEASTEAPVETNQYGPFQVGFQSYSLRHFTNLDDFLREAQKLKLAYVELWRGHLEPTASPERIRQVKEGLAGIGLTANAFGVEQFTADHEKNEALFQFGKALGVRNLSASPTKDAFDSLSRLVQQYDIQIAIHNHGPEDERWRRPEWILEAVQELDPRIGACVDTGHYIRAGVDPVQAIEMLGSRVLGVHFKDFNADMQEVVVGQGQLDIPRTLAALQKVGFKGVFSLEFEMDKEDPTPKMLECLEVIRRAVAQL